jgi:hypothetical protein
LYHRVGPADAVPTFVAVAVSGVMKFFLRPAVWLIANVAIVAVACDRDSPSKESSDGAPVILRGGERLGWDQATVSGANPSSYTFIMYIDGWANTLANVSCGGSSSSGYTCSSRLPTMTPGRHSLTLVASQGPALSPPSRALEVDVVVASVPSLETVLVKDSGAQPRCGGSGPCYRSTELLRSTGVISTPVSAPNGRILFVVDGRQIQLVAPTSTLVNLLLNLELPTARILSVAVPDSEPLVWVTSVETRADESRMLTITRYRLVEDTLGEPAVVVSMSIPEGEPRVVIDSDGFIYIAKPSTGTTKASVLRLMPDGTTPRSQGTPEMSSMPAELRAIALAPEDRVWISGVDDSGRWQLGQIESADASARVTQVATAADARQSPGSDITSLTFMRDGAGQSATSVMSVASGTLYRATTEEFALGSMHAVPWSRGIPIEVGSADSGIFVVTATLSDQSVVYSLFRLNP